MGLALGAHRPAKISQHEVNFSVYRPIATCGLGGDREALTINNPLKQEEEIGIRKRKAMDYKIWVPNDIDVLK